MYPLEPSGLIPLSTGHPHWSNPPLPCLRFLTLINFRVCDGGCPPWGVLQHLVLLQVAKLFCCTRGLPHMGDKRFSPIPKQTKLEKNRIQGHGEICGKPELGTVAHAACKISLHQKNAGRIHSGMQDITHMFI